MCFGVFNVECSCVGRCFCVCSMCVWPRSVSMKYGWVRVSDDGPYTHPVVALLSTLGDHYQRRRTNIAGVRVGAYYIHIYTYSALQGRSISPSPPQRTAMVMSPPQQAHCGA